MVRRPPGVNVGLVGPLVGPLISVGPTRIWRYFFLKPEYLPAPEAGSKSTQLAGRLD